MSLDSGPLRYEPIHMLDRNIAIQQIIQGGSSAINAIYSIALYDEDDSFAEITCLNALESNDEKLRFAAAGAIGEMTVFSNRVIDFEKAELRLIQLLKDYPEMAARIQDSLDDFALAKGRLGKSDGEQE